MNTEQKPETLILKSDKYGKFESSEVGKVLGYYSDLLKAKESRMTELIAYQKIQSMTASQMIEDCAKMESRIADLEEQIEKYRSYCESNGLEGL